MKSLICTDLHLNNSNYGRVDTDGLSFRTRDFCRAFEVVVNQAIDMRKGGQLDRFIITGDIYETPHPASNVHRFFLRQVKRLSAAGLLVDILVGNHDACFFHHAVEPVIGADFQNVKVYYKTEVVDTDDALLLMFPHSQSLERQEIGFRDALHQFVRDTADSVKIAKEAGKDILFFGHFGTFGAAMNGLEVNKDAANITMGDLQMLAADYIFLGDYHTFQRLAVDGSRAFYVGSLERGDFNDTAPQKGYMVYDSKSTGDRELGKVTFVPYTQGRRFVDLTVRSDNFAQIISDAKADIPDSIVRIHFVGTTEEHKQFAEGKKAFKEVLSRASHIVLKKSVIDPVNDKKIQELRHELEEIGHVESSDIMNIMNTCLASDLSDATEREATINLGKVIMSKVKEYQTVTAQGTPGRIMVHGVKMHNFMRFGEENNIVEFDPGSARLLDMMGDSFKMDKELKQKMMSESKTFMDGLSKGDRKLISIVGRIDGNDKDSNGAGKSSVFEGISYGFFEKLVREFAHKDTMDGKSTTSVMTYVDGAPKGLCYVEILFSSESELWLVKRGRKTSKNGATTGEFGIFCLSSEVGEEGSRSGHRKKDASETLAQLLKMDYETFSNSVMFGQMDSGRFIRGTDKVKKEIVIKILQLAILDDYLEETREMKRATEKDIAAQQSHIAALTEAVLDEAGVINAKIAISTMDTEVKQMEENILQAESSLKDKRAAPVFTQKSSLDKEWSLQYQIVIQKEKDLDSRLQVVKDAIDKTNQRLSSARLDVQSVSNEATQCESQIKSLETNVSSFNQVDHDKKIDMVAKAKEAKPQRQKELADRRAGLQLLTSDRSKVASQIDVLNTKIKLKQDGLLVAAEGVAKCNAEIERIEGSLKGFDKKGYDDGMASVALAKEKKVQQQKRLAEINSELQVLASSKGATEGLIGSLVAKMEKFRAKLESKSFTCHECENVVTPEHFESKIKACQTEKEALEAKLSDYNKIYGKATQGLAETKSELDAAEACIALEAVFIAKKTSFDQNSEKLEQQRKDLAKHESDKKALETGGQTELKDLEACTTRLSDLDKAHAEAAIKIADIEKKIANIDIYMTMESELLTKKLTFDKNMESLAERKLNLEAIAKRKVDVETRVVQEETEVKLAESKLADAQKTRDAEVAPLKAKLVEIQRDIDGLSESLRKVTEEIAVLESKLSSMRSSRDSKMAERVSLATKVDEADKTRAKIADKSLELSQKRELLDRLLRLEKVFGLDGMRTQIVEKYLPLLNLYCSEFLEIISKSRMSAAVTMDGGEMDIVVTGSAAPRGELLSGGEFERLRLSMDIALGLLSLYRNDSAPDFVCADEILAPIDEGGKDLMFDVIRKLQDHFRMVVVISHDKMIQEKIKDVIVVSKTGDVSRIEKQAHAT